MLANDDDQVSGGRKAAGIEGYLRARIRRIAVAVEARGCIT